MQQLTGIASLLGHLTEYDRGADTTFALVLLAGPELTADDIIAIRLGAKTCDCCFVATLHEPLPKPFAKLVEEAGAVVLYHHQQYVQPASHCQVVLPAGLGGADITAHLQVILMVMPSMVVVSDNNLQTLRACQAILGSFRDLFTLESAATPAQVLNEQQQALVGTLTFAQDMLDQGERRPRVVLQQVVNALEHNGFSDIRQLALLDGETFGEVTQTLPKHSYIYAEVMAEGQLLRRSVRLRA